MVRVIASFFTRLMHRWLPDAFLFAVILSFVVAICGVLLEQQSPRDMVLYWGDGLWNLLAFSMQMILILVTGYAFAGSALITKGLHRLCGLASTPGQAIVLTTLLAMLCFWINWGFGLIASALVAREVARRVEGVNFPLLVAMAYSGMLIWHGGLSGSIPLKIASPGNDALAELMQGQSIPVAETIFSFPVVLMCLSIAVTVPILGLLMMPRGEQPALPKHLFEEKPSPAKVGPTTPAERMENSRVLPVLLGGIGLWYLVEYFLQGGGLGLNTVILVFFSAGVLLHKSLLEYLRCFQEGIRTTAGIVLQYPLYAGIMGMMVHSGLAASMSEWFVAISTRETFPLYTFLSAGMVNFFVPSGGGQWAVQAPIVVPAAQALGVPLNQAAMAVAFGDAWTNMIQPFWTLPLLAIAGLTIKDIMGYCAVILLWSGVVLMAGLYFFF